MLYSPRCSTPPRGSQAGFHDVTRAEPRIGVSVEPSTNSNISSTAECKQLRLRVAHLEADLLHLQQRKAHLENENEAFAAADQVTKAKLAEVLAENRRLEAELAEKNNEETRKSSELEAQQADIASSLSELQSIFDQFTKVVAQNELGAKLWRSAKSKHIAMMARRNMDKQGHLDSSSPLWDGGVRLRLGSDPPQRSTPRTVTTSRPSPYTSPSSQTSQAQDRPKSKGSARRRQRHGARQLEPHACHVPRDERREAFTATTRSSSATSDDKDTLADTRDIHVVDALETLDQQSQATTPSCGKHQELSEVYDALEREAKCDDLLVDRSFKQDLADARRYLKQGQVGKFPCVGEILADWSSALDKIKDNTSSEQSDIVRREIEQLRQALGQAQKEGKVKS